MSVINEIKNRFLNGGVITKFIMVNLGVFIAIRLLDTLFLLTGVSQVPGAFILPNLSVPSYLNDLIFKPWTVISYMFTHYEFTHILFNMLVLYWFGKMFLSTYSDRQFIGLYFVGGLFGALFYVLSFNFLPYFEQQVAFSTMIGASASVMAMVLAVAVTNPEQEISLLLLGRIKLKYVALAYVGIDLLMITSSNSGGHISHIGGALAGYLYVTLLQRNKFDIGAWVNAIIDAVTGWFKPKEQKMKVKWRRPLTDQDVRDERAASQVEVDRILEKVKRTGYSSLTAKEKQKLFEASNQ